MGSVDVMPTVGNMFGFTNRFALGKDIFNVKNKNIVVFPNGNWLNKDALYLNNKDQVYNLNNKEMDIKKRKELKEYSDKFLNMSNSILVYDLLKDASEEHGTIMEDINVKVG